MGKSFHSISAKETIQELDSSNYGLFENEAQRRLKSIGLNKTEKLSKSFFTLIIQEFSKPFIFLIIISLAFLIYLNKNIEASIVAFLGLFYVLFNFLFEFYGNKLLSSFENLIDIYITVIRDGKEKRIPITELTVGDVVVLKKGDYIPADIRLIETDNLLVDERLITGETVPVKKKADVVLDENTKVEDRENILFKGSYVYDGCGKGIVFAVGKNTYIDKNQVLLKNLKRKSGLKKGLIFFVIVWTLISIGLIGGYIAYDYLLTGKLNPLHLAELSISTLISILAEGIFLVSTILILRGILSLIKGQIYIKDLIVSENIPKVEYLVIDKEGVLVDNRYQVKDYKGENLYLLMLSSALCNNATDVEGNSIDLSVVNWLTQKKFNWKLARNQYKKVKEFKDDKLGIEISVHNLKDRYFIFAKGSIDGIWFLSKNKDEKFLNWYEELSSKGLKVVAYGFSEMEEEPQSIKDIRLRFLGFIGLEMKIKEDVIDKILELRQSGRRIILITEDKLEEALNFAKEVGLYNNGDISLTHSKILNYEDKDLYNLLERCSVVAEVVPEDKKRIVKLLKWKGKTVLATGRYIDDVNTLNMADVSIVDKNSFEALKKVSSIITEDLSLSKIIETLKMAGELRKKVKNSLTYIISTSLLSTALIGTLYLLKGILLFKILQILWLKLFTVITLTKGIPFSKFENRYLDIPKNRFIFNFSHILDILNTSFFSLGLNLALAIYVYIFISKDKIYSVLFLSLALTNIVLAFQYANNIPFFRNPVKYILNNLLINLLIFISIGALIFAFYFIPNILQIERLSQKLIIYSTIPALLTFMVVEISKWIDMINFSIKLKKRKKNLGSS